jgi:hypothetical protein
MRRLGTAMAIALTAVTLTTACGGDDDEGDRGDGGDGGIGFDEWSVESALSELPPTPDDAFTVVRTADLARAAALGDLDPPADDESAWFEAMGEDPIYVPFPASVATFLVSPEEMKEAVGFDIFGAGSFVELQALGGDAASIEVFAPAEEAVSDPVAAQVGSFSARSAHDRVALSMDDGILDDWAEGDGSLADAPTLAAVARALDEHDVYAAVVNAMGPEGGFAYSAVGIGQAVEDGEEVEYVAYVVDDADESAPTIEEAWQGVSDEVSVVEVTTEGSDVVVVELDPMKNPAPAVRLLEAGAEPFRF